MPNRFINPVEPTQYKGPGYVIFNERRDQIGVPQRGPIMGTLVVPPPNVAAWQGAQRPQRMGESQQCHCPDCAGTVPVQHQPFTPPIMVPYQGRATGGY